MFKRLWPVLVNPVIARISPNRIVYTASAGCGFPDYGLTRSGWLSSLTVRIAYSFAHNLNYTQTLAESQGFEPWIVLLLCRFSRPVPSTARPTLLN